jgi:dihydrofolate reductase
MRKVSLGLGISLDGYIARRDGSVDFLFMPKDYSMAPFFKTVDVAIMGRKTLDDGLKMTGGKFDNYGMKCYVMSRTLPPGEHDGYEVTRQSPRALVSGLRKSAGKDIWLMGGGELARDFLKADLVDEIHLGIVPVLIGEGIRLFMGGYPQLGFELVENRSYSRGLVTLQYSRDRQRARPAG